MIHDFLSERETSGFREDMLRRKREMDFFCNSGRHNETITKAATVSAN
jgi:hypothetical protein